MVTRGSPDDFGDEPGMLFDGHVFDEAVVVDEERAGLGVFSELHLLGGDTLSLTGEGCSLEMRIEAVGAAEEAAGCEGPSISVIASPF